MRGSEYAFFKLDNDIVIINKKKRGVYVMNDIAYFILERAHKSEAPDEIALKLSRKYNVTYARANEDVIAAQKKWRKLGLLSGGEQNHKPTRQIPVKNTMDSGGVQRAVIKVNRGNIYSERLYKMLGVTFKCGYSTSHVESLIHPRLGAYETGNTSPSAVIDVLKKGRYYLIKRDGGLVAEESDSARARGWVYGEIISALYPGKRWLAFLHAAAVRCGRGVVLMPGARGSGKSTLAAALTASGCGYYSDDIVPLEAATARAAPFPIDICLKEGSWAVVRRYYPRIDNAQSFNRKGARAKYINIGKANKHIRRGMTKVSAIIFPKYSPGSAAHLMPLKPLETLKRLVESESVISMDQERLGRFIKWVEKTPASEMIYDSLDDAMALARGILNS